MWLKFLKTESGFSMIQALLLASAVGGMAYIGTKVTTDQKLASKGVDSKSKVEELHSVIFALMQNKDHCTQTFLSNSVSVVASGTSTLNQIRTFGGGSPFKAHANGAEMYMNNAVSINRMDVIFPANLTNLASMDITYGRLEDSKKSGKGFGASNLKKQIPITIQRTAAGGFLSCYAVEVGDNESLIREFCQGLGNFVWDAVNNVCQPKDLTCPSGEVFTGIDASGNRICRAIKDVKDFSSFIDPTSAPCHPATADNVRFVPAGGNKVKISCGNGVCTPSPTCATIKSTVCAAASAGVDSCNVSCGNGTKCCASVGQTCADKKAATCYWGNAGSDSCGVACGMGTKNDASCCTRIAIWDHYECGKPISGINWVNMCFYRDVCSQDRGRVLRSAYWDGQRGPTSASGGDTGTQSNCHEKRRKCSGEP